MSLSLLSKLSEFDNHIITTDQVFMEFLKNRQKVILESIDQIKSGAPFNAIPGFLHQAQTVKTLRKHQDALGKGVKKLKEQTEKILLNPSKYDPVYKVANALFKRKNMELNLRRPDPRRYAIRELAAKRWQLGYPPRKPNDTSIGDAVNWEWIIWCAEKQQKDVMIVSRDSDYGCAYSATSYPNDWLRREFRERVGIRRTLSLSAQLGQTLNQIGAKVTEKEISAERTEITASVAWWDRLDLIYLTQDARFRVEHDRFGGGTVVAFLPDLEGADAWLVDFGGGSIRLMNSAHPSLRAADNGSGGADNL